MPRLVLVRAAERLRGRHDWADLAFPVLLLHLGHRDNLLWGFQTPFTVGTLLACLFLSRAASRPGGLGRSDVLSVTACGLLLPTVGANGLAFAPAVAAWLAWSAIGEGTSEAVTYGDWP